MPSLLAACGGKISRAYLVATLVHEFHNIMVNQLPGLIQQVLNVSGSGGQCPHYLQFVGGREHNINKTRT